MSDLEDLQTQVRRMQAMLAAQQDLILAISEHLPNLEAVLATFEKDSQATQDLLLAEPHFSDQELEDGGTARESLLSSLRNAVKRTGS